MKPYIDTTFKESIKINSFIFLYNAFQLNNKIVFAFLISVKLHQK